jgi:3-deoxy-D-manno-octulosonic-acid transferase
VLLYRFMMTLFAAKDILSRIMARDGATVKARLGRIGPDGTQEHIWLHAASNGELTSARPVMERLAAEGRHLLVTVNTDSAREMAREWQMPRTTVLPAPIDLPGPTRRVLKKWRVTAHIALESELWPCRVQATPGPVLVLGGRLTERSAKGWERFERLSHRVLGKVAWLSAQDVASAERFVRLGLSPAARGPVVDLKALYQPPRDVPDADLKSAFDRDTTWLAASTHEGEEEPVLEAHKQALAARPNLKLILAPRHPRRADVIERLVRSAGLTCARRSRGDTPNAQVYLADTFGEMHLWYALAGITFVAGSLTDRGGHTPYEPAAFGSAILYGPDTGNFTAAYQRLTDAQAAIRVTDAASLTAALKDLDSADKQTQLAQAAQRALHQDTDLDGLMGDILAHLDA